LLRRVAPRNDSAVGAKRPKLTKEKIRSPRDNQDPSAAPSQAGRGIPAFAGTADQAVLRCRRVLCVSFAPSALKRCLFHALRPTCLPALVPAILPNTEPDTSPVPPG